MKLTTSASQTFRNAPLSNGDEPKSVTIQKDNFSFVAPVKRRGKKEVDAYLIIGFDTEYQSRAPLRSEECKEGAHNELLSYQFCIRVVNRKEEDTRGCEVTGIICPDEGKRITIADFISIAVGSLVDKYPRIALPRDAILVGHFTRADLPAFDGFGQTIKEFASNIRSTFVSLRQSTKVIFLGDDSSEIGSINVKLRDTINLSPAGFKKLENVGTLVGIEKEKLHEEADKNNEIKQNMLDFMLSDWDSFKDYGIQDARICVEYAERIIRRSQQLFNDFEMSVAMTSFGTKLVLQSWEEAGWKLNDILGREEFKHKKYSMKLGRYVDVVENPFMDSLDDEEAFVTKCFHGGRNEQFIFGAAKEALWRDFDLSSAYATAMSLIGYPAWSTLKPIKSFKNLRHNDLAFFHVSFEFPKSVRFPVLPVRTAYGIIFPRKGHSHCCTPELLCAWKLGAKIVLKKGIKIESDETKSIFMPFNTKCIKEREKHPGKTFDNLFWKEIGNSTYGKTAQGLRRRRVYDLRDENMKDIGPSKITQPFFAAFITSFVRAVLGEIINGLPRSATVFSVTTDGFLTDASDADMESINNGPLYRLFSETRQKLSGKADTLDVKHKIMQPIGWRTRGSATLKQLPDEEEIVLQKGGIKTKSTNKIMANDEVVRLFINRTPESKIHYKSGIGIKDMLRFGTDFVFEEVEKTLSMEFDWKRRPVMPHEIEFTYMGENFTHVGFETEPLEDMVEFQYLRSAWDGYNKGGKRLIKTLNDFEQFEIFRTAGQFNGPSSRYLARQDGDLKRLRRDLVRAFHNKASGFENRNVESDCMRYKSFAEHLTKHGIKCSVTDVSNQRNAAFIPNQCFPTDRAKSAFNNLRRNAFPRLNPKTFFVQKEAA